MSTWAGCRGRGSALVPRSAGRTVAAMATEARWRIWAAAARPRTLPAAVAPVLVGTALAWRAGGFDALAASICLVFALLMQIGANFANDYFDFKHGVDTAERVGPRRAVAAGLVSPGAMHRAMWLTFGFAFVLGLSLVTWGGWWLVTIGVLSIVSGIAYTGGPWPLGHYGFGDLFVFIFFGLVAVCATYYVQTGSVSGETLLVAVAMGLLIVNILVVNNYRDVESDRRAGKRTLVVRCGRTFSRGQFVFGHLVACGVVILLAVGGYYSLAAALLVTPILVACGVVQWWKLRTAQTSTELITLLGWCGLYSAVYAVTLSVLIVAG